MRRQSEITYWLDVRPRNRESFKLVRVLLLHLYDRDSRSRASICRHRVPAFLSRSRWHLFTPLASLFGRENLEKRIKNRREDGGLHIDIRRDGLSLHSAEISFIAFHSSPGRSARVDTPENARNACLVRPVKEGRCSYIRTSFQAEFPLPAFPLYSRITRRHRITTLVITLAALQRLAFSSFFPFRHAADPRDSPETKPINRRRTIF